MAHFNLENYEPVEARLEKFWLQHENGRILTALVSDPAQLDEVVFRAEVYFDRDDRMPVATGYASEKRNQGHVNTTSHMENCETSAIGRALANAAYKVKKEAPRPSREEMAKANQREGTHVVKEHPREAPAQTHTNGEDDRERRRKAGSRAFHSLCVDKAIDTKDRDYLHHIVNYFLESMPDRFDDEPIQSLTEVTPEEWEFIIPRFKSLPHAQLNGLRADYDIKASKQTKGEQVGAGR